MKIRLFPLLTVALLTSCNVKPELRKDIKQFISNFSLANAVEHYKTGHAVSTKETIEGNNSTKEVEEITYSCLDDVHPTYLKVVTNFENGVETSKDTLEFVEIEGQYYLLTNGVYEESSLKECTKLITSFFYKKVEVDGSYHTQGYYYGDYIREVAPVLQKYVTIDTVNELYNYEYSVTESKDGETVNMAQKYSVDKWGMLVSNHVLTESSNKTIARSIYVNN